MQEKTLSIIKPDALERNLIGEIVSQIESAHLEIKAMKMLHMSKDQAKGFYAVHRDKPFFESLTDYMSSGPIVVMLLQGENAIQKYRDLMGATKPEEAEKNTIREKFGKDVEKNSVHGSDSQETAETEISYFFNQLEILP